MPDDKHEKRGTKEVFKKARKLRERYDVTIVSRNRNDVVSPYSHLSGESTHEDEASETVLTHSARTNSD